MVRGQLYWLYLNVSKMYFVYTLKKTISSSRIVQVGYIEVRMDSQEIEAKALETVMWEVSVFRFSDQVGSFWYFSFATGLGSGFFSAQNSVLPSRDLPQKSNLLGLLRWLYFVDIDINIDIHIHPYNPFICKNVPSYIHKFFFFYINETNSLLMFFLSFYNHIY